MNHALVQVKTAVPTSQVRSRRWQRASPVDHLSGRDEYIYVYAARPDPLLPTDDDPNVHQLEPDRRLAA